jgi:hypothetical protein
MCHVATIVESTILDVKESYHPNNKKDPLVWICPTDKGNNKYNSPDIQSLTNFEFNYI